MSDMHEVALAFLRKSAGSDRRVIGWAAGEFVHVELILISKSPSQPSISATCYMGTGFSVNNVDIEVYTPDKWAVRSLSVTDTEYSKMINYIYNLQNANISYNYKDIGLSLLPNAFTRNLIDDISGIPVSSIRSLFCAQSTTLIMRNALCSARLLYKDLHDINSRLTLPNALYAIITPHTRVIQQHTTYIYDAFEI